MSISLSVIITNNAMSSLFYLKIEEKYSRKNKENIAFKSSFIFKIRKFSFFLKSLNLERGGQLVLYKNITSLKGMSTIA